MSASLWWLVGILVVLALLVFLPMARRRRVVGRRRALMRSIERERGSHVVTLIHRREGLGLLGFPAGRLIDIEDSEQILRAIREIPDNTPIDLILHTPGGLVLASDQIAYALRRHHGRVTVFVPHYAMSGGTLIALAADEIIMDRDAVLGPVDPQLGSLQHGYWPAASILAALEEPNANRDDETLIMGDVARKAVAQVRATALELLAEKREPQDAERLATMLSEGRWTHDYPIRFDEAGQIGLPVSDSMPRAVYDLMRLYPQRPQRRPSVEFIPWRRRGATR
jgi:ClpP class serine protease